MKDTVTTPYSIRLSREERHQLRSISSATCRKATDAIRWLIRSEYARLQSGNRNEAPNDGQPTRATA